MAISQKFWNGEADRYKMSTNKLAECPSYGREFAADAGWYDDNDEEDLAPTFNYPTERNHVKPVVKWIVHLITIEPAVN